MQEFELIWNLLYLSFIVSLTLFISLYVYSLVEERRPSAARKDKALDPTPARDRLSTPVPSARLTAPLTAELVKD